MKWPALLYVLTAALGLLAACSSKDSGDIWAERQALPDSDAPPLVTFKDAPPITTTEFTSFWRAHPALTKPQALDALIEHRLIVSDAKAKGLPQDPLTQVHIRAALMQGFAGAWLDEFEATRQPIDTDTAEFKRLLDGELERTSRPGSIVTDTLWVTMNTAQGCDAAGARAAAQQLLATHLKGTHTVTRADFLAIEEATEGSFKGCNVYSPQPWHYTTSHYPVDALPQGWSLLLPNLVLKFQDALKKDASNLIGPVENDQGQMLFAPQRLEPGRPGDVATARARLLVRLNLQIQSAELPRQLSDLLDATSLETFPQNLDDRSPFAQGPPP